jgi:hypothetical protein
MGAFPPFQEAVRLSHGHFLRVFALGLSRPQFVEGDEVVGEDGEADLSFGPLERSTRDPLESAKVLHVREPPLNCAASLTIEGFALWCLHSVSHLVDQIFMRLADPWSPSAVRMGPMSSAVSGLARSPVVPKLLQPHRSRPPRRRGSPQHFGAVARLAPPLQAWRFLDPAARAARRPS